MTKNLLGLLYRLSGKSLSLNGLYCDCSPYVLVLPFSVSLWRMVTQSLVYH